MTLDKTTVAHGHFDDEFADVAREFEANFRERSEVGASVCVIRDGRSVVDLWGGSRDGGKSPWEENTVSVAYSCTKGATSLCAHLLASRGVVSFDDRVGRYWEAFNEPDKRDITIRMLLNHSAGLIGLKEQITAADLADWEKMIALIEREKPIWQPGHRWGYSSMTSGYMIGELVRRVTGTTIGAFFHQEIATPLDADFWIGLPDKDRTRVAPTLTGEWEWDDAEADLGGFATALGNGEAIQLSSLNSYADFLQPGASDTPEAYRAENPSVGGITNARGLARLYAPLARPSHEVDFVSPDQHVQMVSTEVAGVCAVHLTPLRFSAGFEKTAPGTAAMSAERAHITSDIAFGHSGLGGSFGFADPDARFSFGYVMNRHSGRGEPYAARCQGLIDAVYRSLGYRSKASGKWSR